MQPSLNVAIAQAAKPRRRVRATIRNTPPAATKAKPKRRYKPLSVPVRANAPPAVPPVDEPADVPPVAVPPLVPPVEVPPVVATLTVTVLDSTREPQVLLIWCIPALALVGMVTCTENLPFEPAVVLPTTVVSNRVVTDESAAHPKPETVMVWPGLTTEALRT